MLKITPWAITLLSVLLIVPTVQAYSAAAYIACTSESRARQGNLPSPHEDCLARFDKPTNSSFSQSPSSGESYNDYTKRINASQNASRIESRRRELLQRSLSNTRNRSRK